MTDNNQSSFQVDKKFEEIIAELQKGNRPLFKFNEEDFLAFKRTFQQFLNDKNLEGIKQCLCLLDFSQNFHDDWKKIIIQTIELKNDEITVLALGTSHRHIIDYSHRQGNRIGFDFLKILEDLLESHHPEVFEWTLRTIETLGGQSVFFKQKVLKSGPGFLKSMQKKWKNSVELIKFLEQKWNI